MENGGKISPSLHFTNILGNTNKSINNVGTTDLIESSFSFNLWEQFPWNRSGVAWTNPGIGCWGDGGVCVKSKWGAFGFRTTWAEATQTHNPSNQTRSRIPSSHIHVCHSASSGQSQVEGNLKGKVQETIRENDYTPVHQIPALFWKCVCSSLVKSLTPQMEATKEEMERGAC